jgi:light-regulated signal transduction histidine kinase (bacteriophytochrome)
MDCDMRIVWANQAVVTQEGNELAISIGEKCYEVWHGYTEPCRDCPVFTVLQTGQVSEGVVVYPDGRYWKMTGSPVYDKSGQIIGVLGTALEITDLKKAESELKKLNEELEVRVRERTEELSRANKELAAFTYSVSHDLRSPLRGISGFTEAVLEDYEEKLNGQGRDYLERVLKATARMNELIDDLLKLSRVTRQEIHKHQVDLSAMVTAYAVYLQEEAPDRRVEFRVQPGCTVIGDAALLRIALENLINNAWKYTGKNEQALIEFGQYEENGNSVCYVKDDGVGFNMVYKDKVFNAFQRLHSPGEYPGTGVGLSIVQRIIERHGGEIWAVSEEEKGAVFYFSIPS